MADRLQQFIDRLSEVEKRVGKLENSMDNFTGKLDDIYLFITGANTVFGFAKRNWKQAIVFGAGIMTAAGFGNPKVNAFLVGFFGG